MRYVLVGLLLSMGCGGGPVEDPDGACTDDGTTVHCPRHTDTLSDRAVHWKRGGPEARPAVILFQGSTVSAVHTFDGTAGDAWGGLYQARLAAQLVDAGYLVVAPEAAINGLTFWNTNVPPYAGSWEGAPDAKLMDAILGAFDDGSTFGAVDTTRLYAAGISSGGYMTSRMAVSYAGRFKALAIQSASYATCLGSVCNLPDSMPADHPPTVFLHGEKDGLVPLSSMTPYRDALKAQGTEVQTELDAEAGHEWLKTSPAVIHSFFDAHP